VTPGAAERAATAAFSLGLDMAFGLLRARRKLRGEV
jgi:hypothetical protein